MIGLVPTLVFTIFFLIIITNPRERAEIIDKTLYLAVFIVFQIYTFICINSLYSEIERRRNGDLETNIEVFFKNNQSNNVSFSQQPVMNILVEKSPPADDSAIKTHCQKNTAVSMLPTYPDDNKFKPLAYDF